MSPPSSSPRRADRPVVLVTGSAQRLGRAIALDLARHGRDVAVHYRRSASEAEATVAELRALGARAEAFAADLGDEAACRALVPALIGAFGRLDAVVNSASQFDYDDPASFGYAALEQHLRTNTGAPIVLAQALERHLAERAAAQPENEAPRGVVVNLLDQKLWNLNPDFFSYTLSKAALHAATTMLAQALAPRVRVVGVAPGLTLGNPMLDAERFERLHRAAPLGQASTPADIAHAVRFALENRALTGTTLLVDGGQHLTRLPRDFALMR